MGEQVESEHWAEMERVENMRETIKCHFKVQVQENVSVNATKWIVKTYKFQHANKCEFWGWLDRVPLSHNHIRNNFYGEQCTWDWQLVKTQSSQYSNIIALRLFRPHLMGLNGDTYLLDNKISHYLIININETSDMRKFQKKNLPSGVHDGTEDFTFTGISQARTHVDVFYKNFMTFRQSHVENLLNQPLGATNQCISSAGSKPR